MGLLKLNRWPAWAALVLLASVCITHPRAAAPLEYEVKAAFLFNFGQFVDWPQDAFSDPQAPLVICVLGEDRFGGALDDIVQGENIRGRPLLVQRHRQNAQLDCHILFIDRSMRTSLKDVLANLEGQSTLTVGDFEGFARDGGMIRFVTVGQKIRLHINLATAKAAQLSISSKLLRPAQILRPGED